MWSIVKIGWALLKRNKKLNVFMGLILMVCLTGLISAFSISVTTQGLFDHFATQQKSAHILRIMNTKNADIEAIKTYLEQDERVENYQLQFSTDTFGTVKINEYDDILAIIMELPIEPKIDLIKIIDGEVTNMPGLNEVWIPSGLAYRYEVKVGDILELSGIDGKEYYIISAITFDPLYSTSMISPSRIWVRSGQLSMIKGLGEVNQRGLTIRMHDQEDIKALLADFDQAFPTVTYGLSIDYDSFKGLSNILNDIISGSLLATSILLIIISAAIIFFIVSGEIINDYTVFGIYKGLGFSMSQIKNINHVKFTLLVLLVTPVSIVASFGTSRLVLSIYEKTAGVGYLTPKLLLPGIISVMIMLVIIAATIQLASRKLNHLKPAQAIRYGYQSKKRYQRASKPSKFNPVFSLGLKELGLNPLRTGIKIVTITGLATLIFTINTIGSSLDHLFTADLTIGIPNGDLFIQKNATFSGRSVQDIIEDLRSTEVVEKVMPAIISFNNAVITEGERIGLMGYGYDDYYESKSFSVIEGRNPTNNSEVAITKNLAKKTNKNIGDLVTLNVEGFNQTYLITGTFQIMSNSGLAFRITTEAYQKASPETDYSWFSLIAKPNSDIEALKAQLVARFGSELTITIFDEFIEERVGTISSSIELLNYVLVIIMALICGLALYNMIWLQMLENKKHYGLMKAVGMSKTELIGIQLFKMILMTTAGVVVGFLISTFYVPVLLSSMLSTTGIHEVASVQSPLWILEVTLFIYALTILSTTMAVISQSKVNLKSLIME